MSEKENRKIIDNINIKFFDALSDKYDRAAATCKILYDEAGKLINPLVQGKTVLDVGNGGHFPYSTDLPKELIAMDISSGMLSKIKDPRIKKIISDARELNGIEDASVDVIIFSLSLHHINGVNVKETLKMLDDLLLLANCKIRSGGHFIIIESVFGLSTFRVQCFFFHVIRFLLNKCGVPMIFFYTLKILKQKVAQTFQLNKSDLVVSPLELKGFIDPMGASFPGVIRIPAWGHPLRYYIMVAIKK